MAKNAYFTIVAYDVVDDKRRKKIVDKLLDAGGVRVNYSVFECLLPKGKLNKLKESLINLIDEKQDRLIFYQLCEGCIEHVQYHGAEIDYSVLEKEEINMFV
ncbi:MAG: CRISPR-associated endonuclease Cas2 [Thermodesulfovibrionales bacterium]|nr:CRISPR-associated endonuclease Cas2 [Thermodesulfovibrionales bacterium]